MIQEKKEKEKYEHRAHKERKKEMQGNKKQEKGDFIFSLVYLSGLIFFDQK